MVEIVPRGIRASHDQGEAIEWLISDIENPQEGVKRTAVAFVSKLDAFNVERHRVEIPSRVPHSGRRDVDERGARIDEPADQPRTGDAIDLRTLSRDPLAGNPAIARRVGSPAPIQPSIPPSRNWARIPDRTQFNRHLAGDFVSVDTVNNNLAVNGQFAPPALHCIRGSGHGGDKQSPVRAPRLATCVDHDWGRSPPDLRVKFTGCN
jgi:hypothetical protein